MTFKLDEFRLEIQRRDQEILAMAAKMKTLEEQHQVNNNGLNIYLLFPFFPFLGDQTYEVMFTQ